MLHDGSIAEMKTGEGKTLVSTLAAYLNALTGEGVHGMFSVLESILFVCACSCTMGGMPNCLYLSLSCTFVKI